MTKSFVRPSPYEAFCTQTYRMLLDCMARPGLLRQITHPEFLGQPQGIVTPHGMVASNMYALGACMSLIDQETNLVMGINQTWLATTHPAMSWVHVRTNMRHTTPDVAHFAYLWDATSLCLLPQLAQGTLVFPERSTTVFCAVAQLHDTGPWTLRGPGIAATRTVGVDSDTHVNMQYIQHTRTHYPLGIDVFLIDAQGRCLALPRTTRIDLNTH
jgi:alpha-D-ribose 1-methylphosphonate 5-triphosphate synthase subunit PhnH